ncbi:flavin reductase family protein [Streptomyces stramineus]
MTVVTTLGPSGERWGFTASSFSSLSLEPPLVLVCLGKSASTYQAFLRADHFMINVLAQEQSEVALRFAKSAPERFAGGDMVPCELGLPGLPGASARLACATHDILDGGDHSILVGRAEVAYAGEREPLVYYNRSFNRPAPADRLAAAR